MAKPAEPERIFNRLLLSLPSATLKQLSRSLEFRTMSKGDVIARANRPIEFHYFVNRGLISLIKTMKDGKSIEAGVVGTEGCSGLHALLGHNTAVLDAVVQVRGSAFRIKRDILKHLTAENGALRDVLHKYAHFALAALAQTGACNRLHLLEERCCRWLLIAQDSALTDTFQLTHEYMAMMLGAQRAGVSIAASALQRAGLIRYRHGQITVTDRAGLKEAACECYRDMQAEYDRLFLTKKG